MGDHEKERTQRADLARQAIDYLVQTDLVLKWGFPEADPPPEGTKRLLAPYFSDGEIERTTSSLLCNYLVERLREDHGLTDTRMGRSGRDRAPSCRVVCDDGDGD